MASETESEENIFSQFIRAVDGSPESKHVLEIQQALRGDFPDYVLEHPVSRDCSKERNFRIYLEAKGKVKEIKGVYCWKFHFMGQTYASSSKVFEDAVKTAFLVCHDCYTFESSLSKATKALHLHSTLLRDYIYSKFELRRRRTALPIYTPWMTPEYINDAGWNVDNLSKFLKDHERLTPQLDFELSRYRDHPPNGTAQTIIIPPEQPPAPLQPTVKRAWKTPENFKLLEELILLKQSGQDRLSKAVVTNIMNTLSQHGFSRTFEATKNRLRFLISTERWNSPDAIQFMQGQLNELTSKTNQ